VGKTSRGEGLPRAGARGGTSPSTNNSLGLRNNSFLPSIPVSAEEFKRQEQILWKVSG